MSSTGGRDSSCKLDLHQMFQIALTPLDGQSLGANVIRTALWLELGLRPRTVTRTVVVVVVIVTSHLQLNSTLPVLRQARDERVLKAV